MTETASARASFWNRPATWKAFALVAGYLVLYLAAGLVLGLFFGDAVDSDNVLADTTSIFFGLVAPIGIGAIALLVFTWRIGWLPRIFGRQPVRGRGWTWIGPALVLLAILGHVIATDWDAWTGSEVAMLALLGVCIGVAEELATRGLAVTMLRDAGHSERFVAIVSSALFALMHSINLLSGMSLQTVLGTLVYTFGFGVCMYLTMRVTGTIWAAIVLHALTDPTTMLSTGGVDQAVGTQASGGSVLASFATIALIAFGVVAAFLVRGKADAREAAHS